MNEPVFKTFVYQVIVEGNPVIVFDAHEGAKKFVEKNYANANVVILPIGVFHNP